MDACEDTYNDGRNAGIAVHILPEAACATGAGRSAMNQPKHLERRNGGCIVAGGAARGVHRVPRSQQAGDDAGADEAGRAYMVVWQRAGDSEGGQQAVVMAAARVAAGPAPTLQAAPPRAHLSHKR